MFSLGAKTMSNLQWWTDLSRVSELQSPVSLTIGNFDGVHLGHQELIKRVVSRAKATGGTPMVLTFHPHPVQVLNPAKKHVRLFALEDQKQQLEKLGIKVVMVQKFSRDFSELSAPEFLEGYLMKNFHPKHLVIGHDFSFGAHRQGHHDLMKVFCEKHKVDLEMVPPLKIREKIVSTSLIREALANGDLSFVKAGLGRNYYLNGIVIRGEARGRTLGFPTANIKPEVDFYPRTGVYACRVILGDRALNAVTNIGLNRTFVEGDSHPIKVESHILDFNEDIYGREIKIELLEYLREEKKFSGIDELTKQIAEDVKKARGLFS